MVTIMRVSQADAIRNYILENIFFHSVDIVAKTVQQFNVTRTTVHRHLAYLLEQGQIIKSGTTRNIKYALRTSIDRCLSYKIQGNLSEFDVLQQDFNDIFKKFSENIGDVCVYGFTEMFNNALEHSKGTMISVLTEYKNNQLLISIQDNGIGIFQNIYEYFQLSDPREAVFQLTKGKMTTDPTKHTGEGIFFTSRAFDTFEIYANHLHYFRNNIENDWALESCHKNKPGSTICMSIHKDSLINLVELFKQYQDPETLAFNHTEIIVGLSKLSDEPFISRSQAKRVIIGLEKFQQITLDFSGVRLVGQGFVDEVFRVFKLSHPTTTINYINANSDVIFMIKRGIATGG